MNRSTVALALMLLPLTACVSEAPRPGGEEDRGRTVVYRDQWGIPHIYAPDEASGCYAMGWAQAEDRPEQLLKNFKAALGESAEVEGVDAFESDVIVRLFDHYGVSQQGLKRVGDAVRPCLTAFVAGINDFYRGHPEDLPAWWGQRAVNEAMVLAFARLFLYSWSIDDGLGDLDRGGVRPRLPEVQRASNQFAVAPARSAEGAAILGIDPHLSWWGVSRFWEFRIHAGQLQGSGVTLPGFPTIGLGHNRTLAWAMTTGGPDTADVYRLELSPARPGQYRYDGRWRAFEIREAAIGVRGEAEPRVVELTSSHHGPVIAVQDRAAYALRTAYAQEVGVLDAWWTLQLGSSVRDVEAALATLQLFPQNVMAADTEGNIYYQRTGRVPRRPDGFDWSRPVDGSSPASEWNGLHPSGELVQLLNPPNHYMQNCNVPPDVMLPDSPLTPDRYPDYVFSDAGHGELGGWSNPRGSRAVEILEADSSVTVQEAIDLILDVQPFGVKRWQEALGEAEVEDHREALAVLLEWDGRLARDSRGGLLYYLWRRELAELVEPDQLQPLRTKLDGLMTPFSGASGEVALEPGERALLARAFSAAMGRRLEEAVSPGAVYGDLFRVGRGEQSWPVGGGGPVGLSTVRSVGFTGPRPDGTRWGARGQTATQIVVLSDPVRSWSALPIGQSDRPDSPHFSDQAEKLFSPRRLKPTRWRPEELAGYFQARRVLDH